MLRHATDIEGDGINATDGPIGTIVDLLFDDVTWLVRWLVVDTGAFLIGRKVLLPPSALSHTNLMGGELAAGITKQQVEDSPNIRTDQPVSRVMETNLYDFYGWSPYWSMGFYMGGYGYPVGTGFMRGGLGAHDGGAHDREGVVAGVARGDQHLRSIREVTGYHIHALDGEIGHVADFLLEDGDWSVHYLVVDTKNWWPAKKVLISPRSIKRTDWSSRMVSLDLLRQQIKDGPAYDGTVAVDRAYEHAFHGYYDLLPVSEPV
jgi:hypothetical protein